MPKVLEIEAVSATKLKKLESGHFGFKQDPYVVFSLLGREQRTETHRNAQSKPKWAEQGLQCKVAFEIPDHLEENNISLSIRVMNDNTKNRFFSKKDQVIGEAQVSLAELISKISVKEPFEITLETQGSLYVRTNVSGDSQNRVDNTDKAELERGNQRQGNSNGQDNTFACFHIVSIRSQGLKGMVKPYVKLTARGGACTPPVAGRTKSLRGNDSKWVSKRGELFSLNLPGEPKEVVIQVSESKTGGAAISQGVSAILQFADLKTAIDRVNSENGSHELSIIMLDKEKKKNGILFLSATIDFNTTNNNNSNEQAKSTIEMEGSDLAHAESSSTKVTPKQAVSPNNSLQKTSITEGILTITAVSASLTRDVERFGFSINKQDPYMELILLPWRGERQKAKTKACNGAGKEVTWSEELHNAKMQLYLPGPPEGGEAVQLHIKVRDENIGADRDIADAIIDVAEHLQNLNSLVTSNDSITITVNLGFNEKKERKPGGTCTINLAFRPGAPPSSALPQKKGQSKIKDTELASLKGPPLEVSIEPEKPHTIYFTIKRGNKLKKVSHLERQDPFVKLQLQPYNIVAQTNYVKNGNIDPIWTPDHGNSIQLKYPGKRSGDLPHIILEVYDHETLQKHRLIGSQTLEPEFFLRSQKHGLFDFPVELQPPGAGTIILDVHASLQSQQNRTRSGILKVFLEDLSVTTSGDWFSRNDLKICLTTQPAEELQNPIESIAIQNAGSAATFNQELEIPIFDYGPNGVGVDTHATGLVVTIKDKNVFIRDSFLGQGFVDLSDVFTDASRDVEPSSNLSKPTQRGIRTPSRRRAVTIRANNKDVGTLHARIEFIPSQCQGKNLILAMGSSPGFLRVWALEARQLKKVSSLLDRKQDPFLQVKYEHSGESSSNILQNTKPANNAGNACTWNVPLDLPFGQTEADLVRSSQHPGFLCLDAFDKEQVGQKKIGSARVDLKRAISSLPEGTNDMWITLHDDLDHKAGQVRIALDFTQRIPEDLALRDDFAFVPAGVLYLMVLDLEGLDPSSKDKISGLVTLQSTTKELQLCEPENGNAAWNMLAEIPWDPPPLSPSAEALMIPPVLEFTLSRTKRNVFDINTTFGKCTIPLHAFLDTDFRPVEKQIPVSKGKGLQDTFTTLRVTGIFKPKQAPNIPSSESILASLRSMPSPNLTYHSTPPSISQEAKEAANQHPFSPMSGRLHVRIIQGRDLPSHDLFKKQDPFVHGVLEPGGTQFSTGVCMGGGAEPKWVSPELANNSVILVEDADVALVHLYCSDHDSMTKSDLIGFVDIPLRPLALAARSTRQKLRAKSQGLHSSSAPHLEENRNIDTYDDCEPFEGFSQTKWWSLRDDKGSTCGRVQLQLDFTEDWVPLKRQTLPAELLYPGSVSFHIEHADFYTNKDILGSQEAYVKLQWSPQAAGNGQPGFDSVKTKVCPNSAKHADWDETLTVEYTPDIAFGALRQGQTPTLVLQILDKDRLTKDDLIGETRVPLLALAKTPGKQLIRALPLINTQKGETTNAGALHLRMQFISSQQETQNHQTANQSGLVLDESTERGEGGRLVLHIIRARGLKDVQWFGKMDPRVSLRLWPGNQTSRTSEAKDAEKHPEWNETHILDTEDIALSLLDVQVTTGSTLIGKTEIPICALSLDTAQNNQWYPLVQTTKKSVKRVGEIQIGISLEEDAEMDSDVLVQPKDVNVQFVRGPGDLHIHIDRCVALKNVALVGKQDPYVEMEGVGWRKSFKAKSNVDENGGRNPRFSFSTSTELEWSPSDKEVPSLKLAIKNRGSLQQQTIHEVQFSLAPWLLAPGQMASLWIPTYGGGSHGGPYQQNSDNGSSSMHIQLQYIPRSNFPAKPSRPLARSLANFIANNPSGPREGNIHVQVLAARNLTDIQMLGDQDPYIKLTLISGGGNGDGNLHFVSAKTASLTNAGSHPEWDEDLLLPYSESSLKIVGAGSTPFLLVEAWDANLKLVGDKLIARTHIPIFPFLLDHSQVVDSWYPLLSAEGQRMGEIHLGIQFQLEGQGKQLLPSERPENILNIVVLRARNLFNTGDNMLELGSQDPYVTAEFIGKNQIARTHVAQNQGTEPCFDERLQLKDCMPDASGCNPTLLCKVFDHNSVRKDSFIGMFELELGEIIMGTSGTPSQTLKQWFQLWDKNRNKSKGELQLILKRGPFSGEDEGEDEGVIMQSSDLFMGDGKLYINIKHGFNIRDEKGEPPERCCVRVTSILGGKVKAVAEGSASNLSPGHADTSFESSKVVVPVSKSETASLLLELFEVRKAILPGRRKKLLAESVLPNLGTFTQSFMPSPQSVSVNLQSSSSNNQNMRVDVDVQFLPRVAGQFRILVKNVSDVKSQEMFGKNDLRVDVSIDNGDAKMITEKTTTKWNAGASATWEEHLSLLYSNDMETKQPVLVVKVVEVDMIRNDICGVTRFPLIDLVTESLAKGPDTVVKRAPAIYSLEHGNGKVYFGVEFFPDADIFEKEKIEESEFSKELKRMWRLLDVNNNRCLTLEEFMNAFIKNPECSAYFDLDSHSFSAESVASGSTRQIIHDLFMAINTNQDEVIDFDEFKAFMESKPFRDQERERIDADRRREEQLLRDAEARRRQEQEKRDAEARRRREQDKQESEQRRKREAERKAALEEKREIEARRQQEAREREQQRAKERREEELTRRRRQEEYAREAEKRAHEELERLQAEAARLQKEERERKARERKLAGRVQHKRSQDVMLWRTRDVVEWLAEDLELPFYAASFVEAAVDGPLLVALTEDDLAGQLQVADGLHRRKILLRAARLFELHRELIDRGNSETSSRQRSCSSPASAKKQRLENKVPVGEHEQIRLKLARASQKENDATRKRDAKQHRMWKFEYVKAGEDFQHSLERDDPFDWYSQSRIQTLKNDDGTNPTTGMDSEDEDEEPFRQAMAQVRENIVGRVNETQNSVQHRPRPVLASEQNQLLKNGEPMKSLSPSSRAIKALPKEYWFQDHEPWFIDPEDEEKRRDASDSGQLMHVPDSATAHEILDVLREAVQAFSHATSSQTTTPHDSARGKVVDTKQQHKASEQLRLRKVYDLFCQLQNNTGTPTRRLSRLKFQGAITSILRVELNWTQFDRVFRLISPSRGDGTDGTIQFEEFYSAFARDSRHNKPVERAGIRGSTASSVRRSKDSLHTLRNVLFGICETLVKAEITLQELFHGFDRNGSGSISTAEFSSMMKSLARDLTKEQIYNLLNCIDGDFDRRINLREFLDFWLVVFSQWLQYLKHSFLKAGQNHDSARVPVIGHSHMHIEDLEQLILRVDRAMDLTFGRKARHDVTRTKLPGPLTSLLRNVGLQADLVADSMGEAFFDPKSSPRGQALDAVRAARRRKSQNMQAQWLSSSRGARGNVQRGLLAESRNQQEGACSEQSSFSSKARRRSRGVSVPTKDLNAQISFMTDGYDFSNQ